MSKNNLFTESENIVIKNTSQLVGSSLYVGETVQVFDEKNDLINQSMVSEDGTWIIIFDAKRQLGETIRVRFLADGVDVSDFVNISLDSHAYVPPSLDVMFEKFISGQAAAETTVYFNIEGDTNTYHTQCLSDGSWHFEIQYIPKDGAKLTYWTGDSNNSFNRSIYLTAFFNKKRPEPVNISAISASGISIFGGEYITGTASRNQIVAVYNYLSTVIAYGKVTSENGEFYLPIKHKIDNNDILTAFVTLDKETDHSASASTITTVGLGFKPKPPRLDVYNGQHFSGYVDLTQFPNSSNKGVTVGLTFNDGQSPSTTQVEADGAFHITTMKFYNTGGFVKARTQCNNTLYVDDGNYGKKYIIDDTELQKPEITVAVPEFVAGIQVIPDDYVNNIDKQLTVYIAKEDENGKPTGTKGQVVIDLKQDSGGWIINDRVFPVGTKMLAWTVSQSGMKSPYFPFKIETAHKPVPPDVFGVVIGDKKYFYGSASGPNTVSLYLNKTDTTPIKTDIARYKNHQYEWFIDVSHLGLVEGTKVYLDSTLSDVHSYRITEVYSTVRDPGAPDQINVVTKETFAVKNPPHKVNNAGAEIYAFAPNGHAFNNGDYIATVEPVTGWTYTVQSTDPEFSVGDSIRFYAVSPQTGNWSSSTNKPVHK